MPSGGPLTITGTAADGLSGVATAEWQFVSSTNGQVVPNSSNPLTFTPIRPGSYAFDFIVTDVAGNVTIDAVTVASTYTADFDLDGDVDGDDLGDWQTGFGTGPGRPSVRATRTATATSTGPTSWRGSAVRAARWWPLSPRWAMVLRELAIGDGRRRPFRWMPSPSRWNPSRARCKPRRGGSNPGDLAPPFGSAGSQAAIRTPPSTIGPASYGRRGERPWRWSMPRKSRTSSPRSRSCTRSQDDSEVVR